MNIDEIKKNAPSSATHYRQNGYRITYYSKIDDSLFVWSPKKLSYLVVFIKPMKLKPLK